MNYSTLFLSEKCKALLFACFAGLSFSAHAQFMKYDPSDENKEQDLARCEVGKAVFDQTDILKSREYNIPDWSNMTFLDRATTWINKCLKGTCPWGQALTEEQKQDLLEAEFNRKVGNAIVKHGLWGFGKAGIKAFIWFKLLGIIPAPWGEWLAGGFSSASLAYTFQYNLDLIRSGAYRVFVSGDTKTELARLEKQYIRSRPSFSPQLQETLDQTFTLAYCTPSADGRKEFLKKIQVALDLPQTTKPVSYDPANQEDQKRFKEMFSGYTDETVDSFRVFASRHAHTSKPKSTMNQNSLVTPYFEGKPGVGKTTAAKNLSKLLGLPCEVFSLAKIENIGDFVGTEGSFGRDAQSGLLLEALSKHEPDQKAIKNKIILFDDADRVLNAPDQYRLRELMLTLIEPKTKSFYNPYLKADIDLSHVSFIFAGNSELKDEALRNRLDIIHFDCYGFDYKKETAWTKIIPSLVKNMGGIITMDDFTDEDRAAIDELIKNDKDCGFRTIEMQLQKYVTRKFDERISGKRSIRSSKSKPQINSTEHAKQPEAPAQKPTAENAPAISPEIAQLLIQLLAAKKQQEILEQKLMTSIGGKAEAAQATEANIQEEDNQEG